MTGTPLDTLVLGVWLLAAIAYHELGHLLATEYLGTTESVVLFHRQGWLKWLVWGIAVRHDGSELTQGQRLATAFAPLAWLVPAAPLLRWTTNPVLNGAGVVLFLAAMGTLISDLPNQLLGWESTDGFETYELITFRRTHA